MENNSKLYTGNGDKGYTRTTSNFRIAKSDSIIELLGTIDEFISALGVAKNAVSNEELIKDIELVQNRMKDINGEVSGGKQTVTKQCVAIVESMIDSYQSKIGFSDFSYIPDKCAASASLYMARSVIRRAERIAAKAGQFGRLHSELLAYFNRLGDLIYCFAVYAENGNDDNADNAQALNTEAAMNNNIIPQNIGGLTLSMAKLLAEEIEKQAIAMGLQAVIAIVDNGANLMLLHSMDNAYIASSKIAQDKAYTSAALKMSTLSALEMSRGGALDGLVSTSDNRIILLGGGEPLMLGGKMAGGLGVSGGTAMQDATLAQFGAELFAKLYK